MVWAVTNPLRWTVKFALWPQQGERGEGGGGGGGMREHGNGVGYGVVEWVKRSTLRWFGYTERMGMRNLL